MSQANRDLQIICISQFRLLSIFPVIRRRAGQFNRLKKPLSARGAEEAIVTKRLRDADLPL